MISQWLAAAGAGFIALLGGTTSTSTDHRPPVKNGDLKVLHASSTASVDITCLAAAVAAREQSLDSSIATFGTDVSKAYTDRASALASAYSQSGNDVIRKAVKTAWANFAAATKVARNNWTNAHKVAWTQFQSSAKLCGAQAASLSDLSGAGSEVTGQ